jgi:hypothetical protein
MGFDVSADAESGGVPFASTSIRCIGENGNTLAFELDLADQLNIYISARPKQVHLSEETGLTTMWWCLKQGKVYSNEAHISPMVV